MPPRVAHLLPLRLPSIPTQAPCTEYVYVYSASVPGGGPPTANPHSIHTLLHRWRSTHSHSTHASICTLYHHTRVLLLCQVEGHRLRELRAFSRSSGDASVEATIGTSYAALPLPLQLAFLALCSPQLEQSGATPLLNYSTTIRLYHTATLSSTWCPQLEQSGAEPR